KFDVCCPTEYRRLHQQGVAMLVSYVAVHIVLDSGAHGVHVSLAHGIEQRLDGRVSAKRRGAERRQQSVPQCDAIHCKFLQPNSEFRRRITPTFLTRKTGRGNGWHNWLRMQKVTWAQAAAWRARRHSLDRRAPAGSMLEIASRLCGLHAQVLSSA